MSRAPLGLATWIVSLGLAGCSLPGRLHPEPLPTAFGEIYAEAIASQTATSATMSEDTITLHARDLPLPDFLALLVRQTRVSIVTSASLDGRSITMELRQVPVSTALALVARRLDAEVTRVGDVYYLGQLRPEDRSTLVRRVYRLSASDVPLAVNVLLSQSGELYVGRDGLIVLGDKPEVLQRVSTMLEQLEATDRPLWVVQYFVLLLRHEELQRMQLDLAPSGKLAATFAAASLTQGAGAIKVDLALEEVLDLAGQNIRTSTTNAPLMILSDGEEATLQSGSQIPVPQRDVTEFGAVRTVGFSYVSTGLTISASLREDSQHAARITTRVDVRNLDGYSNEAPITSGTTVDTVATLESGGSYLLAQVEERQTTFGKRNGIKIGDEASQTGRTMQVWCRAMRVAGPCATSAPSEEHTAPRGLERLPSVK